MVDKIILKLIKIRDKMETLVTAGISTYPTTFIYTNQCKNIPENINDIIHMLFKAKYELSLLEWKKFINHYSENKKYMTETFMINCNLLWKELNHIAKNIQNED